MKSLHSQIVQLQKNTKSFSQMVLQARMKMAGSSSDKLTTESHMDSPEALVPMQPTSTKACTNQASQTAGEDGLTLMEVVK